MRKNSDYCIILAGGVGRRLWPCSRQSLPKQFLDFFGTGHTLLQQTYDRFVRFISPDHILVSTYQGYADLVREQLPDLPAENVLAEPVQLSTAPAVAWASYHIYNRDPEANVVVTPADQHILDEERFARQIGEGLDYVEAHADFLAIGVKPTVPNTAYGYIQIGESQNVDGMYKVESFSEKPAIEYARLFVESGEFLWNTGLFLWHTSTMMSLLRRITPLAAQRIEEAGTNLTAAQEVMLVREYYPTTLHRSIDLVILDKCENVCVKPCDFGWADIGCWPEIYEVAPKDADDNAVLASSKVLLSGCRNNVISMPENTAAVLKGLEGYLVALQGNVLVVCPNDDPAAVRRMVNEVQVQLGEEYV